MIDPPRRTRPAPLRLLAFALLLAALAVVLLTQAATLDDSGPVASVTIKRTSSPRTACDDGPADCALTPSVIALAAPVSAVLAEGEREPSPACERPDQRPLARAPPRRLVA